MAAGQKLRGLVGQSMATKKAYHDAVAQLTGVVDATSGSGSITATRPCQALIYAWGGGASGGTVGPSSGGGGGAAALFKRVRLAPGQTITYSVGAAGAGQVATTLGGNPGGDTTVTPPSGLVMTAGGGQTNVGVAGGLGGVASGGGTNRDGGAGGGAGAAGSAGTFGGAGGAGGAGVTGGGGGGAGFSDIGPGLPGGAGSAGATSSAGAAYGGGSGANQGGGTSGAGGAGRVVIWLLRLY